MSTNKTVAKIKVVPKKTGYLPNIIVLFVVVLFGVIVQKHISLPQSVIRPIGVLVMMFIFYSAFYKPLISFLTLIAYLPFSKILVGDFGTQTTGFNLTNVLMLIVIIGWFSRTLLQQESFFKKSSLNFPVCAFIMWGILSLIKGYFSYGSVYFETFIIPLKRWLTPIILYFIVFNMVKDKETLRKTVITMMLVILIVAFMAAIDYLDVRYASTIEKARVGGVFEQSNTLGGFFVYNMFLFLGFFFSYFPNFRYYLMLIPFLVCFRGIMVTFSRGAYIGCAFGMIAAAFFKNKILFAVVIFLLIFSILNPMILPPGIRNRMESTFFSDKVLTTDIEDLRDPSAQSRIIIWKGAIEMIKDNPLFGVGYGLFPSVIPSYAPIGNMDAHNTYLILAAEMGIPALILFLIILLIMIKNARWLYKKTKDKFIKAFSLGMLGGLFGLIVVNMFGSRLNSEEVSAYFWIYAGLIMAAVKIEKRKK